MSRSPVPAAGIEAAGIEAAGIEAAGIEAVGIVVPARDEQDRLADCLRALAPAVAAVPSTVTVAVCVVADRCRDATVAVARRAWGPRPGLELLVSEAELTVGQVRDRGVRALLRALSRPAPRTWLLHTDADTTVPVDWVLEHLRHADRGADAVVGSVDLDDPETLPADALCRYVERVSADAARHRHAYAANLGVRASAYTAVGGFPPVPSGEEHALLARLKRDGHRVVARPDVRARTSARLHGRARGGLADLLLDLATEVGSADPHPGSTRQPWLPRPHPSSSRPTDPCTPGSTRGGVPPTTCLSGRSTCWTTRCCTSHPGPSTSRHGCSG